MHAPNTRDNPRNAERLSLGKVGVGLLLLLAGAACSSPPEIRAGGPRPRHDFVLIEGFRGQIRKISVWFEPGHVLQWELIRSDDPERNKIPFTELDYGQTPTSMDQIFPPGVPERPEEGQVTSISLQYGAEGDLDPIVPSVLTRWYQKKGRAFSELSVQEAEETSRKVDRGEKR